MKALIALTSIVGFLMLFYPAPFISMPVSMMSKASAVPPIHNITTDVTNPPEFVAITPLCEGAPNSIAYEGGEVTKLTGFFVIGPNFSGPTLRQQLLQQ